MFHPLPVLVDTSRCSFKLAPGVALRARSIDADGRVRVASAEPKLVRLLSSLSFLLERLGRLLLENQ
jgi:hypothetical protein